MALNLLLQLQKIVIFKFQIIICFKLNLIQETPGFNSKIKKNLQCDRVNIQLNP